MRREIKYFLLWLPAVVIMFGIFRFSSMDADASSDLSSGIVVHLLTFLGGCSRHQLLENEKLFSLAEFLIRKTAHALEYALLGAAFAVPFAYQVGLSGKRLAFVSIACAAGYACADELHQLFVSGRSGRLLDVGIDTAGACIGVLLCLLALKKLRKPRRCSTKESIL